MRIIQKMFRIMLLCLVLSPAPGLLRAETSRAVRFSLGRLEVPTYTFGRAETVAPLFKSIENLGQYPYTALDPDSLASEPKPVSYQSLTLENEYLKVVFLPELGGRIWSAYDKVANKEIFYKTSVIKPSRYNQRGAWPVGNLEVYGPYDAHMLTWPGESWPWAVEQHSDGSASVVLSHIEHFFRNKVSLTVTLHPGRTFLETTVKIWNRSLLPNRYLLWTNAGVPATDGSRFVYPMTKTIGHDSSALGTWPVAEGVDLSWYKNNQNMLGVFGLDLYDNFIAAYDYDADYGTICFTDRRLARGVKTWTWGTGAAAKRHLATYTDSDGPYIEVQSGRFVWDGNYEFIDPAKSDGWTEYWYGAGRLGGLTTANREMAVNLDFSKSRADEVVLAVMPTGDFPEAEFELHSGKTKTWSQRHDLLVGHLFRTAIRLKNGGRPEPLRLSVRSKAGKTLLDYTLYADDAHPNAVFAQDAIPRTFGAAETLSVEELFQKGLGHEKFGQVQEAERAYELALERDKSFAPARVHLGLLALDRIQRPEAMAHFERALKRDPSNQDAHYYLAVALSEVDRLDEARRHYFRLLPSSSKVDLRDYGLALIALREGDLAEARRRLHSAAALTASAPAVLEAYAYVLRRSGELQAASAQLEALLKLDPTSALARAERVWLAGKGDTPEVAEPLDRSCAGHAQGYLELASDYLRLAAWEEAGRILDRGIAAAKAAGETPYPMLLYYRAFVADRQGDAAGAKAFIGSARAQTMRIEIFPFRRESIRVLQRALEIEPHDANAATLLGDLLYSRDRRTEAIAIWRAALNSDPDHFAALRDLGMALLEEGNGGEGLSLLTRASERNPGHLATALLVSERQARGGNAGAARQAFERALRENPKHDLVIEKLAALEAQLGSPERALRLLTDHVFKPRHQSYSLLRVYQGVQLLLALEALQNRSAFTEHLRAAAHPPSNLGLDDFSSLRSPRLWVFEALHHQVAGNAIQAAKAWKAGALAVDEDIEGEGLFHAIALVKTGEGSRAESWLKQFREVNEQRKLDRSPDLRLQAFYLAGMNAAFSGNLEEARRHFQTVLDMDQSHLFARHALAALEIGLLTGLRP
jgi:tetratricopeptide (TPR) repeat protein